MLATRVAYTSFALGSADLEWGRVTLDTGYSITSISGGLGTAEILTPPHSPVII